MIKSIYDIITAILVLAFSFILLPGTLLFVFNFIGGFDISVSLRSMVAMNVVIYGGDLIFKYFMDNVSDPEKSDSE